MGTTINAAYTNYTDLLCTILIRSRIAVMKMTSEQDVIWPAGF
jgi:hypothetical protein